MRICLYSGPGAGKSATAADIFAEFKRKNYSIELVAEYIKTWAYEGRKPESYDQTLIFANQLHQFIWNGCAINLTVSTFLVQQSQESMVWFQSAPNVQIGEQFVPLVLVH